MLTMATTYVFACGEGDTILIDGNEYVVTFDNGTHALTRPVCAACGAAHTDVGVYTSSAGERMCGACVERALEYIVVRETVERVVLDADDALVATLNALDADDARMRTSGALWVDSSSSAWDMAGGMSPDDVVAMTGRWCDTIANVDPRTRWSSVALSHMTTRVRA